MTRFKTVLAVGGIAAALAATLAPDAFAGPLTLRLTDHLGNTATVADEGAGDTLLGVAGNVAFVGALGGGPFIVNVVTGLSDPASSPPYPHLELSSVNIASGAGALSLTIELSQTGFSNPGQALEFASSFGGVLSASIASNWAIDAFVNLDDGLFSTTGTQVGGASGGVGAFAGSTLAFAPLDASYSVTLRAVINVDSSATFSLSTTLQVPEPATLALFGLGLLGLGILRRRAAS